MPKYLMLDQGGVLDGTITNQVNDNDLLLNKIDGIGFQVLQHGVEIVKQLNELVNNHNYQIVLHSKNLEIGQLELLQKLNIACNAKGIVFPRVTAMVVRSSEYRGITANAPLLIKNRPHGILMACYEQELDGKACVRLALSRLLNISAAARAQHIVLDDGPSVILAANQEGWQAYEIGNIDLLTTINAIYQHELAGYLICPITLQPMQHPVLAADRFVYEEQAIKAWFSRCDFSPITKAVLENQILIEATNLKNYLSQQASNPCFQQQLLADYNVWLNFKQQQCFKPFCTLTEAQKNLLTISPLEWDSLPDLAKFNLIISKNINGYQLLTNVFVAHLSELTQQQRHALTENKTHYSVEQFWQQHPELQLSWINNFTPYLDNSILGLQTKPLTMHATKSWHFAAPQPNLNANEYFRLLPGAREDYEKVLNSYNHHKVPNYDIAKVEVIYSPAINQTFYYTLPLLQGRSYSPAFSPTWHQDASSLPLETSWRHFIDLKLQQLSNPYTDSDFPAVKFLPLWHGTKPQILESIFRTGYANLATTDDGYFGRGVYSAYEAEYAYRVYSQGALIMNWVSMYSAYPTIDGDMPKLRGLNYYDNYDTHFVPVVPKDPNNLLEKIYYPTKPNQLAVYHEVVVFQQSQCLPRYLVTLQPSLPAAPKTLLFSAAKATPYFTENKAFALHHKLSAESQALLTAINCDQASWNELPDIAKRDLLRSHNLNSYNFLTTEFKQYLSETTQAQRHANIYKNRHLSTEEFWNNHLELQLTWINRNPALHLTTNHPRALL
jgi:hypothetical protein